MFVVDTDVLVYAANRSSDEHRRCREHLEAWRRASLPWYVTWSVLYEFVRVTTHPRVFSRPWSPDRAWQMIRGLLASPGLRVLVETPRHTAVAAEVFGEVPDLRGNLVHDARTAIVMREHGVRRIYTRDTDFHRFRFLEVLDPLADSAPR